MDGRTRNSAGLLSVGLSLALAMQRGRECVPDLLIPGVFLQHAFGMKLKSHYEGCFRIVIGLDQTIVGMRHRFEACRQVTNALMMIAVDLKRLPAIPARQRSAWGDGGRMAIRVIVLIIDMGAIRALFSLHIPVERSAADHVQQLRSTADPQDRNLTLQGVAQ